MPAEESATPTIRVTFGETEASSFVLNAKTTSSVNDLARAEVWLKPECAASPDPLDLFSEAKIQAAGLPDGAVHDLFTGHVVSAQLEGDAIRLSLTHLHDRARGGVPS